MLAREIVTVIESTYLFNLRRQRLLRSTGDLADKLVEFALAEDTVALALELERRRPGNDRLSHRTRRAVGRPTHSWPSLAHVHWRGRCDVEMAGNWHLGVVKLLALAVAKVALSLLERCASALRVGIRAVRGADGCLV